MSVDKIPTWGRFLLAVAAALITIGGVYAQVRINTSHIAEIRDEQEKLREAQSDFKTNIALIKQSTTFIQSDVREIKQLLRGEK